VFYAVSACSKFAYLLLKIIALGIQVVSGGFSIFQTKWYTIGIHFHLIK